MPVTFQCNGCRTRLSIGRRKAGSSIRCPKCNTEQIVPVALKELSRTEAKESSFPTISLGQQTGNPKLPVSSNLSVDSLIGGAGLALLLCIGAYLAANAVGKP